MNPSASIWFVVPAHGRLDKTAVCLRQLRRTCDQLAAAGQPANAVIVAHDRNLETAAALGFDAIRSPNQPLGRRWNDGYEHAAAQGAGWFIPFGSDDWIDAALLLTDSLPGPREIRCCRLTAVVREDGLELARLRIPYAGGDGVRIIPRAMFEPLGFRPAEEHRNRAIDTSIMRQLQAVRPRLRPRLRYVDLHPLQVVDWKSPRQQLNTYTACQVYRDGDPLDPWQALAGHFPDEALDEMRAVYRLGPRRRRAA